MMLSYGCPWLAGLSVNYPEEGRRSHEQPCFANLSTVCTWFELRFSHCTVCKETSIHELDVAAAHDESICKEVYHI